MEEITLEKIDVIRKRSGLGYSDAKAALEANDGNIVDTLIYLENNKKSFSGNASDIGNELLEAVKDIISKGNVNRIKIKKDHKTLVDIPVNAGIAVGAFSLFVPPILALSAVAAIAAKITIEIERPDGSTEVVNDFFKDTWDQTVEKAKDFTKGMQKDGAESEQVPREEDSHPNEPLDATADRNEPNPQNPDAANSEGQQKETL